MSHAFHGRMSVSSYPGPTDGTQSLPCACPQNTAQSEAIETLLVLTKNPSKALAWSRCEQSCACFRDHNHGRSFIKTASHSSHPTNRTMAQSLRLNSRLITFAQAAIAGQFAGDEPHEKPVAAKYE